MPVTTIEWCDNKIRMIDQTRLPAELVHLEIDDVQVLAEAIKSLRVRGAPAIGIAGAFGILIGTQNYAARDSKDLLNKVHETGTYLTSTRPTAVNLSWAIERMKSCANNLVKQPVADIKKALVQEALQIWQEDRETCRRLAKHGAGLLKDGDTVLTHCNTGALATADYGTAIGVVFAANEAGKKIRPGCRHFYYLNRVRPGSFTSGLGQWHLGRNLRHLLHDRVSGVCNQFADSRHYRPCFL